MERWPEWLTFGIFSFLCMLSALIAYQAHRVRKRSGYQSMTRYTDYVQFMTDKHQLNSLGIAQQLKRSIRGFSAFGISFNTMPILGAIPLLGFALYEGGSAVISIGWPLLSLFGLLVAASLSEMLSTAPTAGGLYHVSAMLSGKRAAWYTGWLQLLGQAVFLVLSNLLAASLLSDVLVHIPAFADQKVVFILSAAAITLLQLFIGSKGSGSLAIFQSGLTVAHIALILLFIVCFTVMFWNSSSFSEVYSLPSSTSGGWQKIASIMAGIMILQRTFLGAEMVSGSGEEIVEPRLTVPWSLYLSTAYMVIGGFISLLLIAAVSLSTSLPAGTTAVTALTTQFPWSAIWGKLLNAGIIVVLISSGMGSMTAASRTLYALAREKGLPFHRLWRKVSTSTRVPLFSLLATAIGSFILILFVGLFSSSVESGARLLLASGIIMLHLSYLIPLTLRCSAIGRKRFNELNPTWALGRLKFDSRKDSLHLAAVNLGGCGRD